MYLWTVPTNSRKVGWKLELKCLEIPHPIKPLQILVLTDTISMILIPPLKSRTCDWKYQRKESPRKISVQKHQSNPITMVLWCACFCHEAELTISIKWKIIFKGKITLLSNYYSYNESRIFLNFVHLLPSPRLFLPPLNLHKTYDINSYQLPLFVFSCS